MLFVPPINVVIQAIPPTWDPAHKNANAVLSNGNLTLSNSSATAAFGDTRSTTSHATGKYYMEFTVTHSGTINATNCVGVCNSTFAFGGTPLTTDTTIYTDVGDCWVQGVKQTGIGPVFTTTGDVVSLAVDRTNGLIWARVNGGVWNTNAGNNPATGTGGITIGVTNPNYILGESECSADNLTVNFGASAFSYTAPSGFGNW